MLRIYFHHCRMKRARISSLLDQYGPDLPTKTKPLHSGDLTIKLVCNAIRYGSTFCSHVRRSTIISVVPVQDSYIYNGGIIAVRSVHLKMWKMCGHQDGRLSAFARLVLLRLVHLRNVAKHLQEHPSKFRRYTSTCASTNSKPCSRHAISSRRECPGLILSKRAFSPSVRHLLARPCPHWMSWILKRVT
jgi:hypothetical protein